MKMMKRLLCLLLTVVMVLSFTACSDNSNSNNNNNNSNNNENNESNGDNSGDNTEKKVIKIALWYEGEIPVLGNSDSEDAAYYSLKHAAEEYGYEIEWIIETQETHFNNFVQKSLNGEVYADILMCHSWNYVSLIGQGLLQPTTEYVSNAEDAERWNQSTYVLNGENWGIMPVSRNYIPYYYFLFNTKLMNTLDLENPQELARRGEWTWEKFREYCAAATDPSKGQYGVGCFMIAHMLKTSNNFDYAVIGDDGKYYNAFTYSTTKDSGMEVLEMVQDMALEDKSIMGDWTDGMESMNETNNAFKDGKLLFAFIPSVTSLKESGFEDYSIVTLPLGPSATELCDTMEAFAFWSLPTYSNFSAQERAEFMMEVLRTWDPEDEDGYFEEDREDAIERLLDESYINREDVEFLLDMGAQMNYYPAINVSWGSLIADNLFGEIIRGNTTPAAAVEELNGEIQAILDATYNNK